ncbi:uncharacterized protein METZ01_LOCUS308719 [marine metagenome]|uniref:Uncharacterized protein n=1 Tax=marine metagenome TaxID=408172 RepID=A0A382N6B3_9ZZZZ
MRTELLIKYHAPIMMNGIVPTP